MKSAHPSAQGPLHEKSHAERQAEAIAVGRGGSYVPPPDRCKTCRRPIFHYPLDLDAIVEGREDAVHWMHVRAELDNPEWCEVRKITYHVAELETLQYYWGPEPRGLLAGRSEPRRNSAGA